MRCYKHHNKWQKSHILNMLRNKTQVKSLKFPLKQENLIRYSIFYNRFHFRTKLKSVTKCLLSAHMAHNQMELFDVIFKTMFEPHWNQVDMFKWQMAPFTRQKNPHLYGYRDSFGNQQAAKFIEKLIKYAFFIICTSYKQKYFYLCLKRKLPTCYWKLVFGFFCKIFWCDLSNDAILLYYTEPNVKPQQIWLDEIEWFEFFFREIKFLWIWISGCWEE